MLRFEELLADFTNTVNVLDFIINLVVATLLSMLIKVFYMRFATTFSNKEKFASIFVPLALTTALIITVVQSSIALSLGLVGALSIVRFRAAIKEPEELTYIFLVIGVGLTCGANKSLLAILAVVLILILVFINTKFGSKKMFTKDKLLINVRTNALDIEAVTSALSQQLSFVELKRMEDNGDGLFLTFITKTDKLDDVNAISKALKALDSNLKLTIIDQPELVL